MAQASHHYRHRIVDDELDELFTGLSAISLDGPKGVGKTETALQRARSIYQLDNGPERERLTGQPSLLDQAARPVLIDEWQQWPPVWDYVRRAVDQRISAGTFILTGSASPTERIHSGAGRIVSVRMRPMTICERGLESTTVSLAGLLRKETSPIAGSTSVVLSDYVDEIISSGFPGIHGHAPRSISALLDSYLDRLLDHDVSENGLTVRRPETLRGWLAAYAAATATTASFETIRDAATSGIADKPAKTTTIRYRDALTRLWILDPVSAWLPTHNHLRKLTATPKHHLADPALAARLLNLTRSSLIAPRPAHDRRPRNSPILGQLFESLVTLSVRVFAQRAQARVYHLRTMGGEREADLIVTGEAGRVLAIEVKLSAEVNDSDVKHLRWLRNEIGDDFIDAVVINTGPYAYRREDGIAVVPAALLGP